MKKSLVLSLLGVGLLAGCGTTARQAAAPPIGVALSPSTAQGIDQGQTKSVTAMVSNDSSNKGVNWVVSMTQGGASCAPGCGSVSPTSSTTAPFTTTYTAPSSSTATVFVTAASAADTTKSASVRITVNATPVLTPPAGGALPAATVGVPYTFDLTTLLSGGTAPFTWSILSGSLPAGLTLNSTTGVISGTAFTTKRSGSRAGSSSTVSSDPTVQCTDSGSPPVSTSAMVNIPVTPPPPLTITSTSPLPNATLGAAYTFTFQATGGFGTLTWTLATGSTLPTGLSLSTDGVLSGTPTQFGGPFTFTVSVTDSESTPMTTSATFSLTIVVPPLTITTTSLPNGTLNTPYNQTVSASGGIQPYTFSLATGSGPLPTGLTLTTSNNQGVISGTPTATGTFNFIIQVTDSETPAMTFTQPLSITIVACTAGPTTLCGQFAFLVQGFKTVDEVTIAGTFTADGTNITGGVLDVMSTNLTLKNLGVTIISGAPSSFTVGTDHRGLLTLGTSITALGNNGNLTFAFALDSSGTFAHIIEFDDMTGSGGGFHQSGFMQAQDPTAFNAAAITGNYAFGFIGQNSTGGRAGMIGIATAGSTAGSCGLNSNGSTTTTNNAGTITTALAFTCSSGTGLPTIDSSGRGNVEFDFSSFPFPPIASVVIKFNFYVISGSKLIFIRTDNTLPTLSGTMEVQIGHLSGFTNADIACGVSGASDSGCVFGLAGTAAGGAHVSAGRAVGQSNGTLTVTIDEDKAGSITKNVTTPGFTFTVSPAGNGTISSPTGKFSDLVLTDTDTGILLAAGGSVRFGIVRPQTATTLSASPGTFVIGTKFPANTAVPNASGILTPTAPATGTLAGTLDVEQILIPGAPVLIPGAPITGTYTLDTTTGRADGTTTAPGPSSFVVYVASGNLLILIENDTMNPFPVLIELTRAHAIFNFDSDFVGEATPFSDTQNGLTAAFSSPVDPGGFAVFPTFFSSLTGNVLIDPGPAGVDGIPLTITFSQDATSISMKFATNSSGPVPFVLTAFENGVQVGQVSASGVIPPGFFFPEGSISFSGARFNSVVLSSTATDIAIDDVDVTPAP